jgi:hypothetical protein
VAWLPEDRRKFLRALDETESRVLVFYRYLLYFVIAAVTVVAVLFYHSVTRDAFRDFLRLYGGTLYLIFLAWAVGQLFAIRNRQARAASGRNAPSPGDPKISMDFSKDPDTGARRFSFHFGSGPVSQPGKTMRFGFSSSSIADEDKLDDAALGQAEAYLGAGSSLDMVCRLLNPRYKDWGSPQQQVYRAYVQGEIEVRKASMPEMNHLSPASASESASQSISTEVVRPGLPAGEMSKSGPRLSPLGQIMIFVVFFLIFTGALLTALFFYQRVR